MSKDSESTKLISALEPVLRVLKDGQRGGTPNRNKARAIALMQQAMIEIRLAYPGMSSE